MLSTVDGARQAERAVMRQDFFDHLRVGLLQGLVSGFGLRRAG